MKDSLFEMLLNLFEQTLTKLKEHHQVDLAKAEVLGGEMDDYTALAHVQGEIETEYVQSASLSATRVFTYEEQMKLTKASYQFLIRMLSWGVISPEIMEVVMNQLHLSESRFVTLQETKWAIRNVLIESLSAEQLAFLDLVLYQKEDQFSLH